MNSASGNVAAHSVHELGMKQKQLTKQYRM